MKRNGFRCIKGRYRTIQDVHEMPNDQAYCPRSHLPTSPIRCRDHRAVRALVYHLSIELSGSPGDDGRTRHRRVALDDSSLGDSLCAGVRKAMEPLRAASEYFLACRRNLYKSSGQM